MATSKEQIRTSYPLPAYNYRVQIGDKSLAFSEASGLSLAFETTTYKESRTQDDGQAGPIIIQMPAQPTPPTITLKRGIIRGADMKYLYDWIGNPETGIKLNLVEKRDIKISLCDETGTDIMVWNVINAFPTKLDAPSFTADSNDASIESMELAAEMITIEFIE